MTISQILETPLEIPAEEQSYPSLVHLLRRRAAEDPLRVAYTFLTNETEGGQTLTYSQLDQKAKSIAGLLQQYVEGGDRVLLLFPPGLDFVASFFGCLYSGAIAVPTQLPPNSLRRTHGFLRFEAVAEDCQPAAILTTSPVLAAAERLSSDIECLKSVRWLRIDSAAGQHAESWGRPELNPDSVGFLQYTSGSTAMPKGVVVTHGNLLYNSAYINAGFEHSSESVGLTWLPHFHDMGLIDGIIQPLYMRFPCYLMPPLAFLQNPSKWLEAIGLYKVTHTGGPNFAYDLCVRKITAEQKKSLDLSSWSVAYNGAEPVRAETLEAFAAAFRDCGFREDAFYPAYGMAEATLKVTGGRRGRGAIFCQINTSALERDSVVEENADGTRKLVGSGQASMGTRVIIVDPVSKTKRLANRVGEVWVAGPGIAQGYWKKSQETIDTFQAHLADTGEGPFLRTGDLGFLRHGQLFVTGRLKDLIIVRGLNHYPQDIELTVQKSHPALRPGGGAVFSVERTSGEQLVILQEVDGRKLGNFETVIDTIRQAVTDEHEISPYAVVLVKTGAIPKTTSGKTQRRAAREMYESGAIEIVAEWIGRETAEAQTEMPAFPELPLTPTVITAWLKSFLAVTLGLDCSSIEAGAPLVRYGLDSLHAVELIHRIERASGDVLSIPDILGNSTLDDVAAKLVNQGSSREQLIQPSLSISRDSSGPCPLSYGQHSLWFLQKIAPESAAYNIAAGVRILSEVDVDALRKSFQILAARHDSLRASFTVVDGVPQQTASDEHTVDFVLRDVSGSDERELNDLISSDAKRPFNLERDQVFRVRLYRVSGGKHVMLLVLHHIVADLWSIAIILGELGEIYSTDLRGETYEVERRNAQYSGYVDWQQKVVELQGDRLWSFWKEQLDGAPHALSLQTDRPRPASPSQRGARINFYVDPLDASRLHALCQSTGVTVYAGLLSAFMLLIHRYTGQPDILVGSPSSGRGRAEFAGVVGYFVNPLVVRGRFEGEDVSVTDLLRGTAASSLAGFEHDDYPFPLLVQRLQPDWDASRSPVFQVLFAFQNAHLLDGADLGPFALGIPGTRMKVGRLVLDSINVERRAAQFDLALVMAAAGDSLAGSFEFATDLFDSITIERMAENFRALLRNLAIFPDAPIAHLQIVSESELNHLLIDFNQTSVQYPECSNLGQLFERQAAETPDRIALSCESQQLTYRRLRQEAARVALTLTSLGAGPDVVIGIAMDRSIEMVIGLVGIVISGAAYLPLDPGDPDDRLSFIIDESGATIVLIGNEKAGLSGSSSTRLVVIGPDNQFSYGPDLQLRSPTQEDIAYVIYTSGSTGRPKGAMNTHKGIINRLLWMQQEYCLDESDSVLQKTPFTFDVSVWEFFWPLTTGARLAVARPGGHKDGGYLIDTLRCEQITTLHFVPSMLMAFLDHPGARSCRSVRRVICSGEELGIDLERSFFQQFDCELHNLYGPTEAAIDVTHYRCEQSPNALRVPIGRPIANTAIYIVDQFDQVAPGGTPGHLLIAGAGLARGYINRPDMTAEKFQPNPFDHVGGSRVYRTGDLARFSSRREIEFLGRNDYQVKVRGFRIELGEIEAALKSLANIGEAVAVARPGAAGPSLIAYLVPERSPGDLEPSEELQPVRRQGQLNQADLPSLSPSSLRRYLSSRLPAYMIPSSFVFLKELPLTRSGKVDRRALPEPDSSRPDIDQAYRLPVTDLDKEVARIFGEALSVDRVGLDDNFFELGGHSLLATKILSRIRERLNVEVPFRSLFENPTVCGLAETIARGAGLDSEMMTPISRLTERDEAVLLSRLDTMSEEEVDRILLDVSGEQGNGQV